MDEHYPGAEPRELAMDQHSIHSKAPLYATFPPAEARRMDVKLEIRYWREFE